MHIYIVTRRGFHKFNERPYSLSQVAHAFHLLDGDNESSLILVTPAFSIVFRLIFGNLSKLFKNWL